jgi:hypothetical protein
MSAGRWRFRVQWPLWLLNWAWNRTAAPYVPNSSGEADDLPPGWRWRVMVRTPGGDWTEWCRWSGNDYDGPRSERDADARAAQFRQSHPGDEARVEKTQDPPPADFGTTFAPLLRPEGGS